MSQKAKARLSVLGIVALVGLVAGLTVWNPVADPRASAALSVEPVIIPAQVSIAAPSSGSSVEVSTSPSSFQFGTADADTDIMIENVTTGGTTSWKDHSTTKTVKHTIVGHFGDLIRVIAKNGSYQAQADIGYVPAPSDNAPVDFIEGSISADLDTQTSTLTVGGGASTLYDNSFPLTVVLTVGAQTDTETVTANDGTKNTAGWSASVGSVSSGDRASLVVTDDVGNVSELVFIAGQAITNLGAIDFHTASPNQVEAENSGTAGMIPVGDGNSVVTAYGRDFIHRLPVCNVRAPILGWPVLLSYRSGIGQDTSITDLYDGPVGAGFDWNLDARVDYDSGDYYWYPGDGRRIGPFEYDRQEGDYRIYDSPPGVFLQLKVLNASPDEIYLTDKTGFRWVFKSSDGYLIRMEDAYAYDGTSSDDELNQVRLTRNDDDHVIRAELGNGQIVTFGWFDHRRLASIRHFDRTVQFTYTDDGALATVQLATGATYLLGYDTTEGTLLETIEEADSTDVVVVENTYTSQSNAFRVTAHRNRHNANTGSAISFAEASSTTTVTDAVGATTDYEYASASPNELTAIQYDSESSDRDGTNGYPGGNEDPDYWRVELLIDDDNYLVEERKLVTEDSSGDIGTDWHRWEYKSPTYADDPRLRDRVARHGLVDPASVATPPADEKFDESWTFGAGGTDFWPSKHTSFDDVETSYTYNSAGQILTTSSEAVTLPSGATGYTITTARAYDDNGRVDEERSADRGSGATYPSTIYTYHDSGTGLGYLETVQANSSSDDLGTWTAYSYSDYGNALTMSQPGLQGIDRVTTYEFDEQDRVTRVVGPDVYLTHSSATTSAVYDETKYVYEADQFRMAKVQRKHWTPLGSSGTGGTDSGWLVTSYTYDAEGRTEKVERDFDNDGTLRRSKSETTYTVRGQVASEKKYTTSSVYQTTNYSYDARGMRLKVSRDPDDGGAAVPVVTWYRYDGYGRTIERYENETGSDYFGTEYDEYGRIEQTVSPIAFMTAAMSSTETGTFRTVTDYNDGTNDTYRSTGTHKEFQYYGGSWTTISEVIYEFDEAGRRNITKTWYRDTGGGSPVYAVNAVDLFPGGGPEKQYFAYDEGSSSFTDYTLSEQDKFERVDKTSVVDSGTTLSKTTTIFDDTDDTGWATSTITRGFDELDDSLGDVFTTVSVHDELGRVIESHEFGTRDPGTANPIRIQYSHYDAMGHVYESVAENYAGTESGVINRTLYNYAGLRTETRRGYSVTSGVFDTRVWEYDIAGQVTYERRVKDPDGTPVYRSTGYTYDKLGRRIEVDSPASGVTSYEYGYDVTDDVRTTTITNADTLVRVRVENQLGHTIHEYVDDWASLTPSGAGEVRYTYGSSSGCGCMQSGLPLVVETYDTSGTPVLMTTVTREYSPRGETLLEEIEVEAPTYLSMETAHEYDAAGRKTESTLPARTTSDPTTVSWTHRADGLPTSLGIQPYGGSAVTVATFEYEGSRQRSRSVSEYAASSQESVAQVETIYDELGRPDEKDFVLNDSSGFDMGFTPTFDTSIVSRTIDGLVSGMNQVPRRPTGGNPVITADYGNAGQLEEEVFQNDAPSSGETITRTYTRDAFDLTSVIEEWSDVGYETGGDCDLGDHSFSYRRDYSGSFIHPSVTGVKPHGHSSFDAFNAHDDFLNSAHYQRDIDESSSGWVQKQEDYSYNVDYCNCDDSSTGPKNRGYYSRHSEYYHDAWGRVTEIDYGRTLIDEDNTEDTLGVEEDSTQWQCNGSSGAVENDPGGGDNTVSWPTQVRVYDGYGRVVYTEGPIGGDDPSQLAASPSEYIGLYHAYDGGSRIMSRGAGSGSGDPEENESHIEYYRNPTTGQPEKLHINRDPNNPGQLATNPWDNGVVDITGSTFATPLYDLQGRPFLMNGIPDSGSNNEGSYPDATETYTMTGEGIEPFEGYVSLWPFFFAQVMVGPEDPGGGGGEQADSGQASGVLTWQVRGNESTGDHWDVEFKVSASCARGEGRPQVNYSIDPFVGRKPEGIISRGGTQQSPYDGGAHDVAPGRTEGFPGYEVWELYRRPGGPQRYVRTDLNEVHVQDHLQDAVTVIAMAGASQRNDYTDFWDLVSVNPVGLAENAIKSLASLNVEHDNAVAIGVWTIQCRGSEAGPQAAPSSGGSDRASVVAYIEASQSITVWKLAPKLNYEMSPDKPQGGRWRPAGGTPKDLFPGLRINLK